ncbi:MAG: hypothetical protein R3E32_14280 [Chitinophagales bacterium]
MKAIFLFFSLLVFCFWEVEGQVPDLPLSFTNEEVRRFKESVEPYCLSYYEEEIESFEKNEILDLSINGLGQKLKVNILQKGSKISVEGGSLFFYKIESPSSQDLKLNFSDFYLNTHSYLYIYNDFYYNSNRIFTDINTIRKNIILLNCLNNNDVFHFNIVKKHPFFGNRLIIEFFEPHKTIQSSELVIGGIVRLR